MRGEEQIFVADQLIKRTGDVGTVMELSEAEKDIYCDAGFDEILGAIHTERLTCDMWRVTVLGRSGTRD